MLLRVLHSRGYFLQMVLCYFVFILESRGEVYIRHGPKHQRVRAGHTVKFHCSAGTDSLRTGSPSVEWRRDDERIKFSKDIRFRKNDVDNTLTIANSSIVDTGLYTCVARLEQDTDSASAQLIVEDVPDPPIDVELMQCSGRYAQLRWQLISENYSPVIQFIIQYNTSFAPHTWHSAKSMLPRDRHYQRIALSPWGNYSFRVIAQNAVGNSKPSKPTTSVCHTPPDVPHHNPKDVCTKNMSPHTLTITWQLMLMHERNAPGFYYLVKWRRHDLASGGPYQERVVDPDQNSLTIDNQPIYKPYEIYVLSINEVGEAVSPPRMFIGYSAEDDPLEVPLNFQLDDEKEVTESTADFVWDTVNTGPWRMQGFFRGYKIQFWKTALGQATLREHSIIYREPGPCWRNSRQKREVATGHVYNLWPFTNITARILAINAKYEGPPSKGITFMTQEGVPGTVKDFMVIRRGSYNLELSWKKPSVVNGNLRGYILSYQAVSPLIGRYKHVPDYEEEIEIDDAGMLEIKLRGLFPETTYRLSICAMTKAGRGQTYELEGTTLPEGPPVAPNFTTVNISKRAINVTWFPSTSGNPGTVFTVQYRRLTGQLRWTSTPEETERSWAVISGLVPGVVYEMRVVARNGDAKDSPETSSVVRRVMIGMKRDLSQPTFKIMYLDNSSFGISLTSHGRAVTSFYVQWKPKGHVGWRSTDEYPSGQLATLKSLRPDMTYEVRVVARSDMGEVASIIQDVVAGRKLDPDQLIQGRAPENGSARLPVYISIVTATLIYTHLATHLTSLFYHSKHHRL